MMKNYGVLGLVMLLSMSGFGSVMGQEPDPAEVKRRMEIYMRDDPAEAKKSAPAPKPRPKPAPTVNYDHEAWKSAEKCGTTACFEVYLEDYPKGRYAKMARARLKSEEPQTPITTPTGEDRQLMPSVEVQSRQPTVSERTQAVVALLQSADQYVKSNQLDKAGAALERALRIEPKNAGIWHDLAQIRLHQGQYQQAELLAHKSNYLAIGYPAIQGRNWKLIASARRASGNIAGSIEADIQAEQLR